MQAGRACWIARQSCSSRCRSTAWIGMSTPSLRSSTPSDATGRYKRTDTSCLASSVDESSVSSHCPSPVRGVSPTPGPHEAAGCGGQPHHVQYGDQCWSQGRAALGRPHRPICSDAPRWHPGTKPPPLSTTQNPKPKTPIRPLKAPKTPHTRP